MNVVSDNKVYSKLWRELMINQKLLRKLSLLVA